MDLFVGRGRVGRLGYLGTNIVLIVAAAVGYRLLSDDDPFTGEITTTVESSVLLIVLGWLSLMNAVRRLHDRSHSGLMAVFFLIPIANLVIGLYLLVAPGAPSGNKYGPGSGGAAAASTHDRLAAAEAANAAARNEPFLNEDGSFDVDGLFRNSDIDRI